MTEKNPIPARLRALAEEIRSKQNAAEAIATGFDLIADCMEPCIDCGAEPVAEAATVGSLDNTTATAQAE